jgi:AGZA family xanthine/uracil permease-like MFS transporter
MARVEEFFEFAKHGTTLRREVLAGLTTFMTMSYILVVNPAILTAAGIPAGASLVATIITAAVGTLLMGVYAKRPFAVAPYMGENAFIAYTVVRVLGLSWQAALGAVFLAGCVFLLMTVLKLRQWLVGAIPKTLRYSFAVGIGLFLTFIGLNDSGIVALGVTGAPVKPGNLTSLPVLLAILGFLLITILIIHRFPGAILAGILVVTVLSMLLRVSPPPHGFISMPPSIAPILFKLDFRHVFTWAFFPIVLTIFVMAFVDTMATLIGVSARAGLLDEEGNLPQIERPMTVDAISTMLAALVGTTTSGAFLESAAGVEAGGRTGMMSVVTALCFVLALFFSPFVASVPPQAYGPALIIVGLMMFAPVVHIPFDDYTEVVPAFVVVALMSFTFNVGIGMTAGFVLYPLCKVAAGRWREVRPGLWVLGGLSLLFFVFYPY